ncbi:ketopantoate reductase family protein [Lachnoclostridium sp. Marseille-P6806]|uniref:ketopantoate reductase family protein n=1 Tax=Lachnoclostridium sp. Marseille-P6806 TaxID=2364793 RepID=UPI001031613A|nr:ketopantoate reductase family protein [Lachnoclostridium sp. Marseille-P6806]
MELQRVALIGAGAIGAYFIEGLTDRPGRSFAIIADGERKERLRRDGVRINGRVYRDNILEPEEFGTADLVLVCVKYHALRGTLPVIRALTGEHTVVMVPMNGIDSEEIVAEAVGTGHIVYSLMRISSARKGNVIEFDHKYTGGLYFGERDCQEKTERIAAIERLFEGTSVRLNFMEDIMSDIWTKYCLNIAYNLPQAIIGAGYLSYFDSEHMGYLCRTLENEVRAVAARKGIHIRRLKNKRDTCPAATRFSTLQDLDAGRHTEIDMFAGVLMEKAREEDVSVPCTEMVYHVIRAMEEKNDGKFKY